jgi:hypothetical protein
MKRLLMTLMILVSSGALVSCVSPQDQAVNDKMRGVGQLVVAQKYDRARAALDDLEKHYPLNTLSRHNRENIAAIRALCWYSTTAPEDAVKATAYLNSVEGTYGASPRLQQLKNDFVHLQWTYDGRITTRPEMEVPCVADIPVPGRWQCIIRGKRGVRSGERARSVHFTRIGNTDEAVNVVVWNRRTLDLKRAVILAADGLNTRSHIKELKQTDSMRLARIDAIEGDRRMVLKVVRLDDGRVVSISWTCHKTMASDYEAAMARAIAESEVRTLQ